MKNQDSPIGTNGEPASSALEAVASPGSSMTLVKYAARAGGVWAVAAFLFTISVFAAAIACHWLIR